MNHVTQTNKTEVDKIWNLRDSVKVEKNNHDKNWVNLTAPSSSLEKHFLINVPANMSPSLAANDYKSVPDEMSTVY